MAGEPAPGLKLDPEAIPRLIAAYDQAALDVGKIILDVQNRGRLTTPWTQDPISITMAEHYNEQVFGTGPDLTPYSTFGALWTYRQELVNARDTLARILADYERTEAEAAAPFSTL